jgi:hypothetical protein
MPPGEGALDHPARQAEMTAMFRAALADLRANALSICGHLRLPLQVLRKHLLLAGPARHPHSRDVLPESHPLAFCRSLSIAGLTRCEFVMVRWAGNLALAGSDHTYLQSGGFAPNVIQ